MSAVQDATYQLTGDAAGVSGHITNITYQTTALRGRLECEAIDDYSNKSSWLTKINFKNTTLDWRTNETVWNETNSPPGLDYGYVLTLEGIAGHGARSGSLVCCANETVGVPGDAAVGYWTDWFDSEFSTYERSTRKIYMTAKWIVGRPLENLYAPGYHHENMYNFPPLWVWPEEPQLFVTNCTPVFEHANASILVETGSGAIHDYQILDLPSTATMAWTDNYLEHKTSDDYINENPGASRNATTYFNMTARCLNSYIPLYVLRDTDDRS